MAHGAPLLLLLAPALFVALAGAAQEVKYPAGFDKLPAELKERFHDVAGQWIMDAPKEVTEAKYTPEKLRQFRRKVEEQTKRTNWTDAQINMFATRHLDHLKREWTSDHIKHGLTPLVDLYGDAMGINASTVRRQIQRASRHHVEGDLENVKDYYHEIGTMIEDVRTNPAQWKSIRSEEGKHNEEVSTRREKIGRDPNHGLTADEIRIRDERDARYSREVDELAQKNARAWEDQYFSRRLHKTMIQELGMADEFVSNIENDYVFSKYELRSLKERIVQENAILSQAFLHSRGLVAHEPGNALPQDYVDASVATSVPRYNEIILEQLKSFVGAEKFLKLFTEMVRGGVKENMVHMAQNLDAADKQRCDYEVTRSATDFEGSVETSIAQVYTQTVADIDEMSENSGAGVSRLEADVQRVQGEFTKLRENIAARAAVIEQSYGVNVDTISRGFGLSESVAGKFQLVFFLFQMFFVMAGLAFVKWVGKQKESILSL